MTKESVFQSASARVTRSHVAERQCGAKVGAGFLPRCAFVFGVSAFLSTFCLFAQVSPHSVKVRVSVKVILDANGNRATDGFFHRDAQITDAVLAANDILAANGADWRLDLVEIIDIPGVSAWFGPIDCGTAIDGIELAALRAPDRYRWRNDAINVYIINEDDENCWGVCSFPPNRFPRFSKYAIGIINRLVETDCEGNPMEENWDRFLGLGSLWLHEVGHFFDLCHTQGCTCGCCIRARGAACKSNPGDDELSDTIPDLECWSRDQLATRTFRKEYAELDAEAKDRVEDVILNVMSYHNEGLYESKFILTVDQLARVASEMDLATGRRRHVVYSDCNNNNVPDDDENPPCGDCNLNGLPDGDDLTAGASPDCNGNRVPDECDLASRGLSFREQIQIPLGDHRPDSLVHGDFDGDGDLDLATANSRSDSVSLLWNSGQGRFMEITHHENVGDSPRDLAAGDLDGDGRIDLAVANRSSGEIVVLLSRGERQVAPGIAIEFGSDVSTVVIADFNADGRLDLAGSGNVDDRRTDEVAVVLNGGSGLFGEPSRHEVESGSTGLLAIDFDGDRDTDLLSAHRSGARGHVSVLLNDGTGAFTPTQTIQFDSRPLSTVVVDIDADGHLDLVVSSNERVWVLRADTEGAFWPSEYALWSGGLPLTGSEVGSADMDGDGHLDVITANGNSSNVSVLRNRHDGTFADGVLFSVGAQPRAVVAGDYDGDGRLDIATANVNSRSVSVLINDSLGPASLDCNGNSVPDECDVAAGILADTDGDGNPDACVATPLIRGDCNGDGNANIADISCSLNWLFAAAARPSCVAALDVNGDAEVDIVDPVSLLNFLFAGGPEPVAPFPECGPDPTVDDLTCESFERCQ